MLTVRDTKWGVCELFLNRKNICFRADGYKIYNSKTDLIKSYSKINPCANGQRSCTVVSHKNGGSQNKVLSQLTKEIWDYLIKNKMITAEYLPGKITRKQTFSPET